MAARLRGADRAVADDLAATRGVHPPRAAVAAIAPGDCSRRSKSRRSFSPPSICRSPTSSPIIWPRPIFVTALSAIVLRRAGRLAALERDPDRLLRRSDCAAALVANRELAGDDRARRQPVVCVADADHALVAGDAGYRAGIVAIRRHVPARRADVADRLGHAGSRQPRHVCRRRLHFGERAVVRQPLAEARAGQRRGAVSIFDDRLGGDFRLSRFRRRAVDRRPSSARPSSSAPGFIFSCASGGSGEARRWSVRPSENAWRCGSPRICGDSFYADCRSPGVQRARFVERPQLFSDDQTPRERRKQSTGVEQPSATKRCSSTPLH